MEILLKFLNCDYTRNGLVPAVRTNRPIHLVLALLLIGSPVTYGANPLPNTIDKIRPSVVAVGTFLPIGSPRQQFRGTGFAIGDGRLIVTNAHVLPAKIDKDKKERLGVFSGRGRKANFHPARILIEDRAHDLAVLSINETLPAISLSKGDRVREGTEIAFTGFPIGMALGLYPVTHRGIVAAISPMAPPQLGSRVLTAKMIRAMREPFDVLQLDATAYPGNSGSPVFDQQSGRLLGVVNSVLVKGNKEAAIQKPSGITYAIPVQLVREILAKARAKRRNQ